MSATDNTEAHEDDDTSQADLTRNSLSILHLSCRYVSVVIKNTVVRDFVDTGADISVFSEVFRCIIHPFRECLLLSILHLFLLILLAQSQ